MSVESPPTRRIHSFVLRQGRVSNAQQRAYEQLLPKFGVPYHDQLEDWAARFGRDAPRVLEIGFGMGETTAAIALANPATDYIAIEVHTPGVGSLLKQIETQNISNIRIVQHDAVAVLEHMIGPASLAGVNIFFTDPWPKTRHHKRRLIQSPLVALLASRMRSGALIHLATDWEAYAHQMLDVLANEPLLANTADGFAPRPDARPQTKFETRGLKLGHGVWDIVFRRP